MKYLFKFAVCCLLLAQAVSLTVNAWRMSPTITEIGQLGAIKYYWIMGYYDVGHHNPPLTPIIAGLPWYICNNTNNLGNDASIYTRKAADHCEYAFGNKLLSDTGYDAIQPMVFAMRVFLIPLIILGGYIGCRFAVELTNNSAAGLVFLAAWISPPLITAWGATLCTDVPAAAMGIIGFYSLWHWFKSPTPCKTVLTGVLLGLMPYTKLTWLIAFLIYPVLFWYYRRYVEQASVKKFVWIIVIAVATINTGYWFDGSFKLLKDYEFISGALTGGYTERGEEVLTGNRFADSVLGYIPVPFPYEFIRGIDTQKLDFERGFTSYAAGLTSDHGWWWYYCYALVFKLTPAVWLLLAAALIDLAFFQKFRVREDGFIVIPAVILFVFVSAQTGFSEHPRYIIPVLPFVCLFICRMWRTSLDIDESYAAAQYFVSAANGNDQATAYFETKQSKRFGALIDRVLNGECWRETARYYKRVPILTLLYLLLALNMGWSLGEKYPMSHFNFVKDKNKTQYLRGSNVDWGQSAYLIRNWCDTHVEARPRYISYVRSMPFNRMGVVDDGSMPDKRMPGWFIISANDIHNEQYNWLLQETPIETLGGGSVFIYYIEP